MKSGDCLWLFDKTKIAGVGDTKTAYTAVATFANMVTAWRTHPVLPKGAPLAQNRQPTPVRYPPGDIKKYRQFCNDFAPIFAIGFTTSKQRRAMVRKAAGRNV
jgi:hypothetical protein